MAEVTASKALIPLNSLWVGPSLGYLEQLCLRSAVAAGHPVRLFSYTPREISGVPEGVELRDAVEVMDREEFLLVTDDQFIALGADCWRYRLLRLGLGAWIDMDLIFLRALDFELPFIFGWQDGETINNAVLGAPKESAFVADLISLPQPNRRPPWFGPKRSLRYAMRRLTKGSIGLADLPWGTYGPELVSYLVRKHKLQAFAQAPEAFYPVPWQDARVLYERAECARRFLTDATRAIHMWHGRLGELANHPPPRGSFIAEMCERFGVEVSVHA